MITAPDRKQTMCGLLRHISKVNVLSHGPVKVSRHKTCEVQRTLRLYRLNTYRCMISDTCMIMHLYQNHWI